MIDYYETKSQPITRNGNGNIHNVLINFVIEQEEPYEGRLSRTVEPVPLLWDGNAGVKFPCVTRL
jgi:hypothetical protein